MIKFKNTLKRLGSIGVILRKGLQDELKVQKHNATGRLSRGLKYQVKDNVLSIISSVSYWKAVNNPKFAKKTNIEAIKRWVSTKGIPLTAAASILKKLNDKGKGYGKPYAYWTEGNTINRTDFAGHTARKFKKKIVKELAPAIGKDVADMIRSQIRKNNPKARVR